MARKLVCALVDDDKFTLEMLLDICSVSEYVEASYAFSNPEEFFTATKTTSFDVCLLDIHMPQMSGIRVAEELHNVLVIFVTGSYGDLKEAVDMAPVDVVTKPINKDRLRTALRKASMFAGVEHNSKYALFNIAESGDKINLKLADIMFVRSDESDPRNKSIAMRDGNVYTLMNCTFRNLQGLTNSLIPINRKEMVSPEVVHQVRHDTITLKGVPTQLSNGQVTLSDYCRKKFMEVMSKL